MTSELAIAREHADGWHALTPVEPNWCAACDDLYRPLPQPKPRRRKQQCSVCGAREHNRTAHGWSGRNMDARTAREQARQRRG